MKVAISFTGGKDSCLALTIAQLCAKAAEVPDVVQQALGDHVHDLQGVQPAMLVTFAPAGGGAFKAHPMELIKAQADALQLPHHVISIHGPDYLASYAEAMRGLASDHGIQALVTGDILDVCNDFMGRASQASGLPLIRPLWGMPRRALLQCLWALGIRPLVSCVNTAKFGGAGADAPACGRANATAPATSAATAGSGSSSSERCEAPAGTTAAAAGSGTSQNTTSSSTSEAQEAAAAIVGRELDAALHASFLVPAAQQYGIDECGEWGELHTMCVDGPTFAKRLVLHGKSVQQDSATGHAFMVVTGITLEAKA